MWNPGHSNPVESQIFTVGFTNGNYGPPTGFCFDVHCADELIVSDKDNIEYNLDERVNAFVSAVNELASFTRDNHVIVTMGADFVRELI